MNSLTGTVLITGAASGIGRATVPAVLEAGAAVALFDRDGPALARETGTLLRRGVPWERVLPVECDVTDADRVDAAVAEASRRLGPVTGLVTAAGIERGGPTHTAPFTDWRQTLDVDLTGTFSVCRSVLRHHLGDNSPPVPGPLSIVLLSSPAGFVGLGGQNAAYAAAKGGVSALVRALATEYGPRGVRVNAVVPGATETPLMWVNTPAAEVDAVREEVRRRTPLRRLADPADVAKGIRFLLSDDAGFVTGSHLFVDGGLTAEGAISV